MSAEPNDQVVNDDELGLSESETQEEKVARDNFDAYHRIIDGIQDVHIYSREIADKLAKIPVPEEKKGIKALIIEFFQDRSTDGNNQKVIEGISDVRAYSRDEARDLESSAASYTKKKIKDMVVQLLRDKNKGKGKGKGKGNQVAVYDLRELYHEIVLFELNEVDINSSNPKLKAFIAALNEAKKSNLINDEEYQKYCKDINAAHVEEGITNGNSTVGGHVAFLGRYASNTRIGKEMRRTVDPGVVETTLNIVKYMSKMHCGYIPKSVSRGENQYYRKDSIIYNSNGQACYALATKGVLSLLVPGSDPWPKIRTVFTKSELQKLFSDSRVNAYNKHDPVYTSVNSAVSIEDFIAKRPQISETKDDISVPPKDPNDVSVPPKDPNDVSVPPKDPNDVSVPPKDPNDLTTPSDVKKEPSTGVKNSTHSLPKIASSSTPIKSSVASKFKKALRPLLAFFLRGFLGIARIFFAVKNKIVNAYKNVARSLRKALSRKSDNKINHKGSASQEQDIPENETSKTLDSEKDLSGNDEPAVQEEDTVDDHDQFKQDDEISPEVEDIVSYISAEDLINVSELLNKDEVPNASEIHAISVATKEEVGRE